LAVLRNGTEAVPYRASRRPQFPDTLRASPRSFPLDWNRLPWKLPEPTHVETLADDGKVLDCQPAAPDGDTVSIPCEPGVFAYRLTGD